MSQGVLPRPAALSGTAGQSPQLVPARTLRATDEMLLVLLAEHEVLTTTQLVRLLALPERTVQHRLGCLSRRGLVNRLRPPAELGTSPYHCWLTGFGAAAVGAQHQVAWSDDPAGVRAKALLSELWLLVRDWGEAGGLRLGGWRRLPTGLEYRDPRSGDVRSLPVEAEVTFAPARSDETLRALVVAPAERLLPARLVALVGRFAACLASRGPDPHQPSLLVVCRTPRSAATVLEAARELTDAPVVRHLAPRTIETALVRVAVGIAEPRPSLLATERVWSTPADRRPRRLADVLSPNVEHR